jgi:ribosomal protein S27E
MGKLLEQLLAARAALQGGDLTKAYVHLAASSAETFQEAKCPQCSNTTDVLVKNGHTAAECAKCGTTWGTTHIKTAPALVKSQQSERGLNVSYEKGHPQVIEALWSYWTHTGGQGIEASAINNYAATGIIAKSLLEAAGLNLPAPREALVKQASPVQKAPLSKQQVLDTMQEMFRKNEEPNLGLRHAITKFAATGELDGRIFKAVLAKHAGDVKDKGPVLEDQEGIDPCIADPHLEAITAHQTHFGVQPKPEPKHTGGIGAEVMQRLVFDNPSNGDSTDRTDGMRTGHQGANDAASSGKGPVANPAPTIAKSETSVVAKAMKSLAPSPSADPKASLKKEGKSKSVADGDVNFIGKGMPSLPGLPKLPSVPAAPGNAAIEAKQAAEPEASAHSLTAPKAKTGKTFDPKTIGISAAGKKTMAKPATPIKKSEALARIEKKMEALGKSADPLARAQLRGLGELFTKVSLMKGEEVFVTEE